MKRLHRKNIRNQLANSMRCSKKLFLQQHLIHAHFRPKQCINYSVISCCGGSSYSPRLSDPLYRPFPPLQTLTSLPSFLVCARCHSTNAITVYPIISICGSEDGGVLSICVSLSFSFFFFFFFFVFTYTAELLSSRCKLALFRYSDGQHNDNDVCVLYCYACKFAIAQIRNCNVLPCTVSTSHCCGVIGGSPSRCGQALYMAFCVVKRVCILRLR